MGPKLLTFLSPLLTEKPIILKKGPQYLAHIAPHNYDPTIHLTIYIYIYIYIYPLEWPNLSEFEC
jgi:hypothetical protein